MNDKTMKTLAGSFAALALLGMTACGRTSAAATPVVAPAAQVQPAVPDFLDPQKLPTRGSAQGRVLYDCTWTTTPRSPYVRCY